MKYFLISILFLCTTSFATSAKKSLYDIVWPDKIIKLKPTKQYNESDVANLFGKANKVDKNIHYYAFDGIKYPLAITYKNKKVISLHYRLLTKKSSIDDLRSSGIKYKLDPMHSHDTLFKAYISTDNLTLTFKKASGKLYSIEQEYK